MTTLTVDELKTVADLLLSHLQKHGVEEIRISDDFYWDVSASDRYDRYDEPKKHNVGQLSDDIREVKRLLEGEQPPIGHGLVWLASILRRIGETSDC